MCKSNEKGIVELEICKITRVSAKFCLHLPYERGFRSIELYRASESAELR